MITLITTNALIAAFAALLVVLVVRTYRANRDIFMSQRRDKVLAERSKMHHQRQDEQRLRAKERRDREERHRCEQREWQQEFDALLPPEPPKPPCTSTAHSHTEIVNGAGQVIVRYCDVRLGVF